MRVSIILFVSACRIGFDPIQGQDAFDHSTDSTNDGKSDAAISNVQTGLVTVGGSGASDLTATLANESTPGTLLVLAVGGDATVPFVPPNGWTIAASTIDTLGGVAELFFLANNPGGIISATTMTNGSTSYAQLTEWSGVSTSSTDGSVSDMGTVVDVTPSIASAASPQLAITSIEIGLLTAGPVAFTAGTGWVTLGDSSPRSVRVQFATHALVTSSLTVDESINASSPGNWNACIATFQP